MFSIQSVAECFLGSDGVISASDYTCLQVKAIQLPCSLALYRPLSPVAAKCV